MNWSDMKIFSVDFLGVYPAGNCLIIAATNLEEAIKITRETITHTNDFTVTEVDISKPKVIVYLSGDY